MSDLKRGSRPKLNFFFSSRRRHTRSLRDWSSDVCSSDLDEHCAIGRKPALATLDVDELFAAEIRAEARLGHDVVAELQRRCGGKHGIAAVSDVSERPAMDEGGRAFERLYQIGRERLLEQRGHRPMRLELAGAHRLAVARIADHDFR